MRNLKRSLLALITILFILPWGFVNAEDTDTGTNTDTDTTTDTGNGSTDNDSDSDSDSDSDNTNDTDTDNDSDSTDNDSDTDTENENTEDPTIVDVNFTAIPEDNGTKIEMSWGNFNVSKDAKWFKIMASKTNDNPLYPDDPAIRVLDPDDGNDFTLIGAPAGEYYYRICMVAEDNTVYCSDNVVKINTVYTTPEPPTPTAPEIIDVNFEATTEDDSTDIEMSWGDFNVGKDAKWFKIMASKTNDNPLYPDDPAIRVLDPDDGNDYVLVGPPAGEYYYRICMVAEDDTVYCSENVVKINTVYTTPEPPTTGPQFVDVNFTAVQDDTSPKIVMNWDSFDVDKTVKWYKVVGSRGNDNPIYPEDRTFKVLEGDADTTFTLMWPPKGEYYYRVCMVAEDDSVYCSTNVVMIDNDYVKPRSDDDDDDDDIDDDDKPNWKKIRDDGRKMWLNYKKAGNADWKEKQNEYMAEWKAKRDKYLNKWKEKKEDYNTKIERDYYGNVDKKLDTFYARLDAKFDTNEEKVEYLEEKIDALNALADAKPKYRTLVDFIIDSFELKIQEYTNPDEMDEIDDILGL